MKLFDDFDAVWFSEENLIFVTKNEYIYYIYNPKWDSWHKHRNAGNDYITVENYKDVTKEELTEAMGGVFPAKETDFLRLCNPIKLRFDDFLKLLDDDFSEYMADETIDDAVYRFLSESDILSFSYKKLNELFSKAIELHLNNEYVIAQITDLSSIVIGRNIFKEEIRIVDGHDHRSYFWIMPVRVVDYSNTNSIDMVAKMKSVEISIEENDVDQYLTPFLYKYFDEELEANKKRVEHCWEDDDGNKQYTYIKGFSWYLDYNYYTFDFIRKILNDINDTIDALSLGKENEYTTKLRVKRGWQTNTLIYAKDMTQEQIDEYNANRPTEDHTSPELLIDFYRRFVYRMEYMLAVGEEKGYNLISFMGP